MTRWPTHRLSWRSKECGLACFAVAAVIILIGATYSVVLLGPRSDGLGRADGLGSLTEVVDVLREDLAEVLVDATPEAVRVAAREPRVDLASSLDAMVTSELRTRFPLPVLGWHVDLLDIQVAMVPVGGSAGGSGEVDGAWRAEARAVVELTRADASGGGTLRVEVLATGRDPSPNEVAARAGALLSALGDPSGPVGFAVRGWLWGAAQGRALAGVRDPGTLVTREDVGMAVRAVLEAAAGRGPPPAPDPPPFDLRVLVRQSVEGVIESSLGWFDDYLCLGDGLRGFLSNGGGVPKEALGAVELPLLWELEVHLRDLASDALTGIVMGVLEERSGALAPIDGCGGLSERVVAAVEEIERLSSDMMAVVGDEGTARDAGLSIARAAVDGLLDALGLGEDDGLLGRLIGWLRDVSSGVVDALGDLAVHATHVLSAAAVAVAEVGLMAARDALMAVRLTGIEVLGLGDPGEDCGHGAAPLVEAELTSLEVSTRWSGEVACEPGGLARTLVGLVLAGAGGGEGVFGSLPYAARCAVGLEGTVVVRAMGLAWEETLSMEVEVPVATGWALHGLGYAPSRTLPGDLGTAAAALYRALLGAAGWVAARVRDAAQWAVTQARGLCEDLVENVLGGSAYTLSRHLWRIGEALVKRRLNDALNGTWGLIEALIGDSLRERLTWRFELLGSTVSVSIDPFRQQLGVGVDVGAVSVDLTLRRLCDPNPPFRARPVDGWYWGVFGEARLDTEGAEAVLAVDPLTLETSSVLTLTVRWDEGGSGPTTELVVEALAARRTSRESSVRLSDVLEGAGLLSLGGAGGVDVGLVLRGETPDGDDLMSLATRALKEAWFASVAGWRVGELVDALRTGPDAGLFLEMLLRELHFSLVDRATTLVAEVEAFVEVGVPGPSSPSVRVSLVLLRPLDLLLPLISWVGANVKRLVGSASSGGLRGAASGLEAAVAEHLLLRFELLWAVEPPPFLRSCAPVELPSKIGLALRGEVNVAALGAVAGSDWGRWEASLEVLLRGVPGAALAVVPGMGSPSWGWADVTLARVVLRDSSSPRLLISQVLYDAEGRDADLEFVELLNAGDSVVDLGGLSIADDVGSHRLRGHLPLLPGGHLLVVRNRTAARAAWGVDADSWGMGLRLSNDGDAVRLLWGDGRVLDEVAWEGHLDGWALEAVEGLALRRRPGDVRPSEPTVWEVGEPCPRRSHWW